MSELRARQGGDEPDDSHRGRSMTPVQRVSSAPDKIRITDVSFTAASSKDAEAGLLGWVSCLLNDSLRLDSISLRRTVEGAIVLSFPGRRDRRGHQHVFVRPLNDRVRLDVQG